MPTATALTRVLVLRSCRTEVFAQAVAALTEQLGPVEVTALSHPGHVEALTAAGARHVVEVTGRRFGLVRTPWRTIRALRRERFDLVVVPQMFDDDVAHCEVRQLAFALGTARLGDFTVARGLSVQPRQAWRRPLWHCTWRAPLRALDVPALFLLMAAARVWPRRAVRPAIRPRVLHVITTWGVGGAQVQLASLAARTAARHWDVEIFVLGQSDGDFSAQHLADADVPVRYAKAFPDMAATVLELAALCRRERYDVVHTWLFLANVLGATAARLAGTPHVISGVRNLSLWKRTWYARPWYRLADTVAARLCDVLTVNATALRDDHAAWARVPASRIHVVPNGLDPARLIHDRPSARTALRHELGLPSDAVVLGTVGRLAPEKDHETFLRIVAGLHAQGHAVTAVIAGDGERRASLEAAAASLGLAHHVRFLGTRSDAPRVLAGLDLFLLTSRIEGMANVLIEAAMLGVPTVATDAGGAADVLIDTESLFPAGDVAAGIAATRRILGAPRVAEDVARATRAHALAALTADRNVARWWSLYPRPLMDGPTS
ncbi:MAG: glycosyltransferase [Vicinamibacterales bacterium]|nr:glycosyltransferase [Vicinamibacterales bacterium]